MYHSLGVSFPCDNLYVRYTVISYLLCRAALSVNEEDRPAWLARLIPTSALLDESVKEDSPPPASLLPYVSCWF
jgi:hypothetical protein